VYFVFVLTVEKFKVIPSHKPFNIQ